MKGKEQEGGRFVKMQKTVEEVVRDYYPQVYRLLYSMCRDQPLSQDLSQETFLRWIEHTEKYQEQGKLKFYLFRIAVNLLRDEQRKKKPEEVYEECSDADRSMDGALWFYRNEDVKILNSWIEQLPAPLREVIILRNLQEMTFAQTAEVLQIPVSTVKSRYKKALSRLREMALADREGGGRYEQSDRTNKKN